MLLSKDLIVFKLQNSAIVDNLKYRLAYNDLSFTNTYAQNC